MPGRLRERFTELPWAARYGIVSILLLVTAAVVVLRIRAESFSSLAGLDFEVYRKCTGAQCGKAFGATFIELAEKGYIHREFAPGPLGEGRRCSACRHMSLRFAEKCPNCSTMFFLDSPEGEQAGSQRCPKCNWDSRKARRDKILKKIGD